MDFGKMGDDEPTRAFLSKCLGTQVTKVEVKPGTKPGEGYSTLHLAIKVDLAGGGVRHLFLKSFPEHPIRQTILKMTNAFYKEYKFYCEIIPDFEEYQRDLFQGQVPIKFGIPQIISADGIDYSDDIKKDGDHVARNYILMADAKQEQGFQKMHAFHRLNLQETLKVIDELAKIHAVSWAIKKKYNLETLQERYPSWVENLFAREQKSTFDVMIKKNLAICFDIIEKELGEGSEVVKGMKSFFQKNPDHWEVCSQFVGASGMDEVKIEGLLRKPLKSGLAPPIEDSWAVLTQTDLWINNMLMKFKNGNCEEIMLLDFQYSRESCPTIELVFLLYICADAELRKSHISEILRFYHQRITTLCKQMRIEPFPGFTLENLERRFHRARTYGTLNAFWCYPMLFIDPDLITDTEQVGDGKNGEIKDFVEQAFTKDGHDYAGTPLKKTLIELVEEAYDLGIF